MFPNRDLAPAVMFEMGNDEPDDAAEVEGKLARVPETSGEDSLVNDGWWSSSTVRRCRVGERFADPEETVSLLPVCTGRRSVLVWTCTLHLGADAAVGLVAASLEW
eukprot:COSAG02_NODE_4786_length_4977_cov_6.788233_2_plen_106_part_00